VIGGPARLVLNRKRDPVFEPQEAASGDPIEFHRSLPGYVPTPLVPLTGLAKALGVATIVVKNEERRLGLPSYKVLGSSWALHEEIKRRLDIRSDRVLAWSELRIAAGRLGSVVLCTGTAGNHGRGVAAVAQALGFRCVVFVPRDTASAAIDAISSHGATVNRIDGSYDDTFAAAREAAAADGYWFCPDAAYGEVAQFPIDVENGYGTLFREMVDQLGRGPDVLFVQVGAGVLASTAVNFFRRLPWSTRIVTVEPEGSNCLQASIARGVPTEVEDRHTIMAGLRCQRVSVSAWPSLARGVDAAVTISDDAARAAVRMLADIGVSAGASGAAALAGFVQTAGARDALGILGSATVAVVNTEASADETVADGLFAATH
jgi:diaminopropionate ammonia-lyase